MENIYREQYIEKMKKLMDKQIIKVLTGIHCCGKSTILKEFQEYLLSSGVKSKNIAKRNIEIVREYEI